MIAELVILVGPAGAGKSTFLDKYVSPEEVVSTDAIRAELTGDFRDQSRNREMGEIYHQRISDRLKAGKRVFADATHLNGRDRIAVANIGLELGAEVTYLIINRPMSEKLRDGGWRLEIETSPGINLVEMMETKFQNNIANILRGDGLNVRVIDTRYMEVGNMFNKSFPRNAQKAEEFIRDRGYKGVIVIGDIHGNLRGLENALEVAFTENLFPVFLGDIVDYGDDNIAVANIVMDWVENGKAIAVRGNHEKKIAKITRDYRSTGSTKSTISHGNAVTLDQIASLLDRGNWEDKFLTFVDALPDWQEIGKYLFVHAAAVPQMFGNENLRSKGYLEKFAMFGETTGVFINGFPERIYNWCQKIPDGHFVVVGHDIRSRSKPFVDNTTVFLDTGSSKGGLLHGMIIRDFSTLSTDFVALSEVDENGGDNADDVTE